MQSFYLPCYPVGPKEEQGVRAVRAAKMMVLDGDIVKYRQRLKKDPEPLNLEGRVKQEPKESPEAAGSKRALPVDQEDPKKETTRRRQADQESPDRSRRGKSPGGERKAKEEPKEERTEFVVLREAEREPSSEREQSSAEESSEEEEADFGRSPSGSLEVGKETWSLPGARPRNPRRAQGGRKLSALWEAQGVVRRAEAPGQPGSP